MRSAGPTLKIVTAKPIATRKGRTAPSGRARPARRRPRPPPAPRSSPKRRARGSRSRGTRRARRRRGRSAAEAPSGAPPAGRSARRRGRSRRRACEPRPPSCAVRASSRLPGRPGRRSPGHVIGLRRDTLARLRPSRAAAGSAPRDRRCRRASACPCRTGGTSSRSRRAARASSSGSRTCSRRSSARSTRTYSGWMSAFMAGPG